MLHQQFWIDDRLEWDWLVGVSITTAVRAISHETNGVCDAL
jgi:hypothetical protein